MEGQCCLHPPSDAGLAGRPCALHALLHIWDILLALRAIMLSDWERKKWLTHSSSLACCLSFCSRLMSNHNSSCTAGLLNLGDLPAMAPCPGVQGKRGLQKPPVMCMFWAIGAAKGTSIPGESPRVAFCSSWKGKEKQQNSYGIYCVSAWGSYKSPEHHWWGEASVPTDPSRGSAPEHPLPRATWSLPVHNSYFVSKINS